MYRIDDSIINDEDDDDVSGGEFLGDDIISKAKRVPH